MTDPAKPGERPEAQAGATLPTSPAATGGAQASTTPAQEEFGKYLLSSLKNFNLYPIEHPVCVSCISGLHAVCATLLREAPSLVLGAVSGELVINGQPFAEKNPIYRRLAEEFARKKIEKITIERGVEVDELRNFIIVLSGGLGGGSEDLNKLLKSRGVSHIRAGSLAEGKKEKGPATRGYEAAQRDYLQGMEIITGINAAAAEGQEIKMGEVSSLARLLVRGVLENRSPFLAILNLHTKDDYTATHSLDVALLTVLQTDWLKLDEAAVGEIACAAMLHDLGKLQVPNEILNKPGGLSDAEWETMRMHAVWGAEMSRSIKGINPLTIVVAFEHHLRYNCTGYPQRRRSEPLSAISLMVAVADTYDAMRSKRPYQKEYSPEEVTAVLTKGSGTSFHPAMVQRFLDRVGAFGMGGPVLLESGETAIVETNRRGDPYHPTVRIILDPYGRVTEPRLMDTSDPVLAAAGKTVVKSLPPDERLAEVILTLKK